MYFTHFQTEDGLPSREVYCMAQDNDGYIWFGTDNGISRFDGYEFKNYQIPNNFEANVVNSAILKDNTLWFGSMFFGAYYLYRDRLMPYAYNHKLIKYKGKYITSILEHISDSGDFYFSLFNYGIIKIDRHGKVTEYKIDDHMGFIAINVDEKVIGTRTISYFLQKNKANKEVVLRYEGQKKFTTKLNFDKVIFSKFFQNQKMHNDAFYFFYDQISQVKNGKITTLPISQRINSMSRDETNKIYLGFGNYGGIGIADSDEELLQGKYSQYLQNNIVSSIYIDKLQNLWVTTINNGVFYCKSPSQAVYNVADDNNEIFISAVEPINDNECYFGTSNGEIYHIINGSIKKLPSDTEHNYICDELAFNRDNQKLYSNGGYYKNNKWHELIKQKNKRIGVLKNFSLDTLTDRMWLANYRLFGFFDNDDNYITYPGIDQKDFIRIFDILYHNDTLWLATQNGLYAARKGNQPCVQMLNNRLNERINCIAGDNHHNLYLGTKESGIFVIKKNGHLLNINKSNGLKTNNIKFIFVDKNRVVWACSNTGLDKITLSDNDKFSIRNFNTAHGLPSNEIYQIKSMGNTLWVATGKGLVKFVEKAINQYSPKPIITKVSISNKSIKPSNDLQLKYRENNIQVRYRTINPLLENKIKYRYKFFEKANWIYTSSTSLELVELQSGRYNLAIQSANEDGIWSDATILNFSVATPWWQMWHFYILAMLIIAIAIYYYLKYRTLRLTKENKLLLELSRLEKMALQNQMNPHFLSNSFTSLQYLIHTNKVAQADEYLSDLSRLLRKILDSSRSQEVALRNEIELIRLYLQLEKIRFENKFDYTITIEKDINLDKESLPPMLIQPIIENAINHAFSDTIVQQNLISIEFYTDSRYLYCVVKDNGIGIANSLAQKPIDATRKSFALSIIKDRIENYNQTNIEKIDLQFQQNSNGQTGTTIKFSFPRHLF